MTGEPRLALTEVTVRFGGIVALDRVTIAAAAGEVLGIIGPNGAGKTTLFDVIAGIRKPSTGRVLLDGVDVTATTALARARKGVRRTFQRVQPFGWLTVEDNVVAAMEWRGGGGGFIADVVGWPSRRRRERDRRRRAEALLTRCGLTDVRGQLASSLPIGIARMVELARAVADQPSLLMLDEPASCLDATELARLGEQIQQVRSAGDCAVLLVEHNAGFVMQNCDRVIVLDRGRVLAQGTPEEIQRNEFVQDAYLGRVAVGSHLAVEGDEAPA
jgi:branched-chain amino acid transport system ATP-binding protein